MITGHAIEDERGEDGRLQYSMVSHEHVHFPPPPSSPSAPLVAPSLRRGVRPLPRARRGRFLIKTRPGKVVRDTNQSHPGGSSGEGLSVPQHWRSYSSRVAKSDSTSRAFPARRYKSAMDAATLRQGSTAQPTQQADASPFSLSRALLRRTLPRVRAKALRECAATLTL